MAKNAPTNSGTSIEMTYQGPLPPSSELEKYEQIAPGAADAIISNFIAESHHRRGLQENDQRLDALFMDRTMKAHSRGLYLALFSVVLILGVGVLFMLMGHAVEGAGIICSVIIGLAACFIYGSRGMKKPHP